MSRLLSHCIPAALALVVLCAPLQAAAQGRSGGAAEARQAVQEANALLIKGKLDEAEALYRRAIQKDVQLEEAYNRLSMLLFTRGRHEEGARVASTGLREVPDSTVLSARLGMNLSRLGRHKEAHRHLARAAGSHRDRFEIQAIYAQTCLRQKDHAGAIVGLRAYLQHRPARLARRDPAFQVMLATALLRSGDLAAARTTVTGVLKKRPRNLGAQVVLAELLLREKSYPAAVTAHERLRRKTRSIDVRLRLGQAYIGIRRFGPALAIAEEVLAARKDNSEALLLQGDAAMGLRRHGAALAAYDGAAGAGSADLEVDIRRARALLKLGRPEAVLRLMTTKQMRDDRVVTLKLLAALDVGKIKMALEHGQRLLKQGSPADLQHPYHAALAYTAAGKHRDAVKLLDHVLAGLPRHRRARDAMVRALCKWAQHEVKRGNIAVADAALRKARRLWPRSVIVNRNIGYLGVLQGRNETALKALDVVLEKVPQDYAANRLAGRALAAMGQYPLALIRLEAAVSAVRARGGVGLARALDEAATVRLRLNQPVRAVRDLKEAQAQLRGRGSSPLATNIQQNLVRARVRLAQWLLKKGQGRKAHREIQRALGEARKVLSEQEHAAVQAAAVMVALASGHISSARRLVRKVKARGKLGKVLKPPYNRLGARLLLAYTDYLTPSIQARLRAAARLQRLAQQVPPPARGTLARLALSALERAAVSYYKRRRLKGARKVLALTRRPGKMFTAEQRHNLAAVRYATGKRKAALETLSGLQHRIPLATCNRAVHHDNLGHVRKAYSLYLRCARSKAPFPGLKQILEMKKQFLGGAK